jgi:hypothetical protein
MVYFITDGEFIKIGKSENPIKRMKKMQTGNARELKMLGYYEDYDEELEGYIHKSFSEYRVRGEWFRPSKELYKFIMYEIKCYDSFLSRLRVHKEITSTGDDLKDVVCLTRLAIDIINQREKMNHSDGRFLMASPKEFVKLGMLENQMPSIFNSFTLIEHTSSFREIFRK